MTRRRPRRQLSCKKEVSLIADYLAASFTPQVKQAFDAHLEACPDCVAFLQTYRKTIEITGAFLKLQSFKQRPRRLALRPPPKPAGRR
jgi:anti-sigma factor RsiW